MSVKFNSLKKSLGIDYMHVIIVFYILVLFILELKVVTTNIL